MNPNKLFPLVVTDKLEETRKFYVDQIGCELTVDMPEYVQVRFGSDASAPELAFMTTGGAPALSPHAPFAGEGLTISIPTESADKKHAQLAKKKVNVTAELADRPWGWRSFVARDPNGVYLDFFHVLEQSRPVDATG